MIAVTQNAWFKPLIRETKEERTEPQLILQLPDNISVGVITAPKLHKRANTQTTSQIPRLITTPGFTEMIITSIHRYTTSVFLQQSPSDTNT